MEFRLATISARLYKSDVGKFSHDIKNVFSRVIASLIEFKTIR